MSGNRLFNSSEAHLAPVNIQFTLDPKVIRELEFERAQDELAKSQSPTFSLSLEDFQSLVTSLHNGHVVGHEEITGRKIMAGDVDWTAFGNAETPKAFTRRGSIEE